MAVVGLVVHPERAEALELAHSVTSSLKQWGHQVVLPDSSDDARVMEDGLDLAVSLGGDGTMLRTVELAAPVGVPIIGVNLGHLGYLTEVDAGNLESALQRFLGGDYGIEQRMTLEVSVESARERRVEVHGPRLALNEAVVERTVGGHTIRLATSIAGRPFISYAADGLLVSTPTGSTAYNLSARGPIVSPSLQALIVTPLSPHMLFDRPLVLEPAEWLRLQLIGTRAAVLVVDGAAMAQLEPGDVVVCRAGEHPARLVTFGQRDFHAILKTKFGLTDR